jgi:O-antigen ligase
MARLADGLAAAAAMALPWSSSAFNILLVLWLLAIVPTLRAADLRRELATPAGVLPVALVLFAAFGMTWSAVSWPERLGGLDSFLKLLLIPILFAQFRRSGRGHWVLGGFLASCILLLALSCLALLWPHVVPSGGNAGVPVKNAATQSTEFVLCAFALTYFAVGLRRLRPVISVAFAALAAVFLINVYAVTRAGMPPVVQLLIASSVAALLLLLAVKTLNRRTMFVLLGAAASVCVVAGIVSPPLRAGLAAAWTSVQPDPGNETNPLGSRPEFWKKSVRFIGDAPLLGHGTGSVHQLFAAAKVGTVGHAAAVTLNPHQQTLAVGIQLGVTGIVLLWAMWLAHLALFRGGGLAAFIGLIVVTQNIVGSLVESALFDFTLGWIYVFGVGIAGGMMSRLRDDLESA